MDRPLGDSWKHMYSVYLIKNLKNGKIYVGSTSKNSKERLEEHNKGTNKWTKGNRPFQLVYYEEYVCSTDARKREKFLKSGVGNKIVKAIIEAMHGE